MGKPLFLLEAGRLYDSGQKLGIYEKYGEALQHPVFQTPDLEENDDFSNYWESDSSDIWVEITALEVNQHYPFTDSRKRKKKKSQKKPIEFAPDELVQTRKQEVEQVLKFLSEVLENDNLKQALVTDDSQVWHFLEFASDPVAAKESANIARLKKLSKERFGFEIEPGHFIVEIACKLNNEKPPQ